ncbi:hypothetical protein [Kiritimatiella glycovorans]|nr:hypothetical protein [Kiritimatiella glycovorans]
MNNIRNILIGVLLLGSVQGGSADYLVTWNCETGVEGRPDKPSPEVNGHPWGASYTGEHILAARSLLDVVPASAEKWAYVVPRSSTRSDQAFIRIRVACEPDYALCATNLSVALHSAAGGSEKLAVRWSVDDFASDLELEHTGNRLDFRCGPLDTEGQTESSIEFHVYNWGSEKGTTYIRRIGPGPEVSVSGFLREVTEKAGVAITQGDMARCMTPPRTVTNEPKHDAQGRLLPHQSYHRFIKRGMDFVLYGQDEFFQGDLMKDESGRELPPYYSYAKCRGVGVPYGSLSGQAVYPGFHHSIFIETLLTYHAYSGNEDALKEAIRIGDWNIAHRTPAEGQYPNLAWSTFIQGKPGGFHDKDAIMTDKAAIMGLAWFRLYEATGEERFLAAARETAESLAANVLPEGRLPFRVEPVSGEVREDYTSSQIFAVMLMEKLDAESGETRFEPVRGEMIEWLLQGPVESMDWRGFYEDVGDRPENRTNWDAIETARYFIRRRDRDPRYLPAAMRLYEWMDEMFVAREHYYSPAEGFREQLVCYNIMGVHTLHWAQLLTDLYELTGDQEYRRRVRQILNFATYLQADNDRIVVGPWHVPFWYSCHFGSVHMMMEILDRYPEWLEE